MGSTLFLLDHDHEIQKAYRYDAFGNIMKETGDIPNHLTYTGQVYDGVAGAVLSKGEVLHPCHRAVPF